MLDLICSHIRWFSSSPNGASENLANKEKGSTVSTRETPSTSPVLPEVPSAPGQTEPLLYIWLFVTKSRETFPGWMGEEATYAPPPLVFYKYASPFHLSQSLHYRFSIFTPTFSKLQWHVFIYAHGSFRWQICFTDSEKRLCFTDSENYMRLSLAGNYLIRVTMLMMLTMTEQASQVNGKIYFKPG